MKHVIYWIVHNNPCMGFCSLWNSLTLKHHILGSSQSFQLYPCSIWVCLLTACNPIPKKRISWITLVRRTFWGNVSWFQVWFLSLYIYNHRLRRETPLLFNWIFLYLIWFGNGKQLHFMCPKIFFNFLRCLSGWMPGFSMHPGSRTRVVFLYWLMSEYNLITMSDTIFDHGLALQLDTTFIWNYASNFKILFYLLLRPFCLSA